MKKDKISNEDSLRSYPGSNRGYGNNQLINIRIPCDYHYTIEPMTTISPYQSIGLCTIFTCLVPSRRES